jgi:penicillin-binding protein 1A
METALKGVPVTELKTPPEGIVNVGGEWYYDDFGPGRGVASLGVEAVPAMPPPEATTNGTPAIGSAPPPEERNRILDLFRN